MTRRGLAATAVLAAVAGIVTVQAVQATQSHGDAHGPGTVDVNVHIQHSRFHPDHIDVRPGTTVRFHVINDDPIGHELIVGRPDVHARHATGKEAFHPPVPGEVSVGALGTAMTTYTFDEPGRYVFACHLPRHFEYGMRGLVRVD